ncbi:N-acetylmuramoyl-L-alanine amidase [Vitiosangium sp. GDMCC 1.1324]|uniref:peptidoglycan recognition protein family protein n=1 Tax=Vitiosangium sp. (strain GDMCC 1.1324) TaxID=2138576 RepID=UPI000D3742D2|nr:N-acetylmuramoyl-L-alanine amidase [Vitiosangium sp. GDMCC 1.1324]PTL76802.1 N-acetylmuramoyl-L-alanine amidase [Vitiosangium sp. GDMCC 1.1324]
MPTSNATASGSSGAFGSSDLPDVPLSEGSTGLAVQRLQSVLIRLKYLGGRADGDFGPKTKDALSRFQRDWRLTPDGAYGPETRTALQKALTPVFKPPVVSRASPNFESRQGVDIDVIVLHHTGTNRVAVDLATLRLSHGSGRVSAHYLIAPTGTVYQLVPDNRAAWHAGVSSLRGVTEPSVNLRSIGIEITNDGSGQTPFTEAQYRALEQLVPYLARTYKVPKENILGHRDVAPGRKTDPADNFDWPRVRRAVDVVL